MEHDRIDPLELMGSPVIRFRRGHGGFRLRMTTTRWMVGRDTRCDVCLPDGDATISRRHLILQRRGRRIQARSVGRAPALLNGLPLGEEAKAFRPGDVLRVGSWRLELETEAESCPSTAPPAPQQVSQDRHGLIGRSPAIDRVRAAIDRFAPLPLPVLLLGETGSGKERVARAIHAHSDVSSGPFVAVNCGALLGDTSRAELFGHVRGAFTGADRSRPGAFVEADGGTLFLDEIGELSTELQAAVLRALDVGEIVPVGATSPLMPSVRVVAATHRGLRDGEFRQDLLYRLDVVSIDLPPLRARPEDVPLLAEHFLDSGMLAEVPVLSDEAAARLMSYEWPGNVRELRNCVLRAGLLCEGRSIEPEHIRLRPRPGAPPIAPEARDERGEVLEALRICRGNRTRAAQYMGVARSTLYERLRRLEIKP